MTVYENFMGQLDDAGMLFNVREERLMTDTGMSIPNRKVIINDRDNLPMGIVSDNYKVVSNEQVMSAFVQSIIDSGIDTTDARLNVRQSAEGARSMVDFEFPAVQVQPSRDTSQTILRISTLNSYDGTTRLISKAGGLRMRCLNGQITGKVMASYSCGHNKQLDIEEGASRIMHMIQEFQNAREYWDQLAARQITDQIVDKVFCNFLEVKKLDDSNARVTKLRNLWDSYQKEMGCTAYALYNVLTDYVSHKTGRGGESSLTNQVHGRRRIEIVLDQNKCFA